MNPLTLFLSPGQPAEHFKSVLYAMAITKARILHSQVSRGFKVIAISLAPPCCPSDRYLSEIPLDIKQTNHNFRFQVRGSIQATDTITMDVTFGNHGLQALIALALLAFSSCLKHTIRSK
jgi:hypothetical protein